ncbi:MAG: glycosyltransferase [Legionellales bacterium]|jgi:hypothetical protein
MLTKAQLKHILEDYDQSSGALISWITWFVQFTHWLQEPKVITELKELAHSPGEELSDFDLRSIEKLCRNEDNDPYVEDALCAIRNLLVTKNNRGLTIQYSNLNVKSSSIEKNTLSNPQLEAIPDNLHIIWLGSSLKAEHRERIINWRTKNPNHRIFIWFEQKHITPNIVEDFENFCSKHNLELHDVNELENSENESIFIFTNKIYQKKDAEHIINYAAMSDFYRYLAVGKYGGWYADTDIISIELTSMRPYYGFYINVQKKSDTLNLDFSPSFFGACENSQYCQKANDISIAFVSDPMASILVDDLTKLKNRTYIASTVNTSGQVGIMACVKLTHNGTPLLTMTDESFHDFYSNEASTLERVSIPREITIYGGREKSWYGQQDTNVSNADALIDNDSLTDADLMNLFRAMIVFKINSQKINPIEINTNTASHELKI